MAKDSLETPTSPTREKLQIISNHFQKASSNNFCLEPQLDPNGGGIHVLFEGKRDKSLSKRNADSFNIECTSTMERGDELMSCPSLSIALDPIQRSQRCGYCAQTNGRNFWNCKDCYLVSICHKCQIQNVQKWHKESGECTVLSCLVRSHHELQHLLVVGEDGDDANVGDDKPSEKSTLQQSNIQISNKKIELTPEMANQVDSLLLLTVRIMIRRWYDDNITIVQQSKGTHDQKRNIEKECTTIITASPFPDAQWALFDQLYSARGQNTKSNDEDKDKDGNEGYIHPSTTNTAVGKLCRILSNHLKLIIKENNHNDNIVILSNTNDKPFCISEVEFDTVMNKVIGCSHAITDVNAPLGCQSLGRALFLQHSFYNHSCIPNAFLSCYIPNEREDYHALNKEKDLLKQKCSENEHKCALFARVHCIKSVIQYKDPITISYIPTSGLDCKERRERLEQSYGFYCSCDACKYSCIENHPFKKLEDKLRTPNDSDIEILRQMQFSCNEQLIEIQRTFSENRKTRHTNNEDEETMIDLQNCVSTIRMNQRGAKNQGIPKSHEISIEAHRLHAFALSLLGEIDLAVAQHELFVEAVLSIKEIYDPVALATTLLEYAKDLANIGKTKECYVKIELAHECAKASLGADHVFVKSIQEKINCRSMSEQDEKRQRTSK